MKLHVNTSKNKNKNKKTNTIQGENDFNYLLLQDKSLQSFSSDKESLVEQHWKDGAAELSQDYCFSRSAASPIPAAAAI